MTTQGSESTEKTRRPPPVRRTVPVLRIEQITPSVRRITFGGPEMAGFSVGGPAESMKIYFPAPGQEQPLVPEFGVPLTEGQPRPIGRTYTPRHWRPESQELDIDFILHEGGPGNTWALEAKPGSLATLSTPKGAYPIDPAVGHYLIAGDQTALPAISTILEALTPSVRADVLIEIDDPADEQNLPTKAAVQVNWILRSSASDNPGRVLEAAIRQVAFSDTETRVFVASEAAVMRDIRRYLLTDCGLTKQQIYTHGYWKFGEANHSDSDRGEDA